MSLVDADGASEVGTACSHPLLEAKNPRELALLVKHYRLLQVRQGLGGRQRGIALPVSSELLAGFDGDVCVAFCLSPGWRYGGIPT